MKPRYFTRKRTQGHKPGKMNGIEAAYRERLLRQQVDGEIHRFDFESVTLAIAEGVRYTPDFVVWAADGVLELHETKAQTGKGETLIDPTSRVKIRVAAEKFPEFRFKLCVKKAKKNGGDWMIEEVGV